MNTKKIAPKTQSSEHRLASQHDRRGGRPAPSPDRLRCSALPHRSTRGASVQENGERETRGTKWVRPTVGESCLHSPSPAAHSSSDAYASEFTQVHATSLPLDGPLLFDLAMSSQSQSDPQVFPKSPSSEKEFDAQKGRQSRNEEYGN